MANMAPFNLDWSKIRALNGSSHSGFEELCSQLARDEIPKGARFERKGTPDAGVECYAVLKDESEWGWQAKFFDSFGNSQWSQLDESVKTALKKHPRLVQYFICIPLDLPDARIPGRRSAKEQWDQHVKKWIDWAKDRGISIEFIFWGSSELLLRLSRPEQIGRLRFWFDHIGFDEAWLRNRLDESLKTAGPRYTPEIHVDLPIAADFEALGRTEHFFNNIKANARDIRKKISRVGYADPKIKDKIIDISPYLSAVTASTESILLALGQIDPDPVDDLPFSKISTIVDNAIYNIDLFECERKFDDKEGETSSGYRSSPFRERLYAISSLRGELDNLNRTLAHSQSIAESSLLLLTGEAGTGKTHLLCDVARSRIDAGRPTVLLLGQRFISTDEPWRQTLQQLDLSNFSVEEFVGALESAAQATGCRALVLIDALNEGTGRAIWPNHLAAFLSHLERSKWIATCLSIRSSYLELVIPEELRLSIVQVTHLGFTDHEYDATKTYFDHYNLELPSTPLLAPEFRNPFFLKTLCRGLNLSGKQRLPRGFHGITSIFNLFLGAINDRLSKGLNFNLKRPLVNQALESFVIEIMKQNVRWLSIAGAEKVVNALLPMREYEHSLYGGLVAEGVLVEEAVRHGDQAIEEVVFIGYERFADHIYVKTLLEKNLDLNAPHNAFTKGSPLDFLNDEKQDVSPGVLEALCVQIPELTGNEFITLAPNAGNWWDIGDAFRQSLIWRSTKAFSKNTPKILNRLIRNEYDRDETMEVFLTVATLHEHPFNADFLDKRLRRDKMPDRDAWWSTFLHKAWQTKGAVHRLVDWASSITSDDSLDDKTVTLSSIVLTWMLTTSNRFLRDRATMALVDLLTGRISDMTKIVEQFFDVDDPYVLERVYAVAYGVAMRCQDSEEMGILASKVYGHVFEKDLPPAHINLRDYARGVIERALYLGANINVETDRIRPPYGRPWPHIPTEDEIKPFMPDWSRGSHDSRELEWARNRIGSSIMNDDFGRYIIGTNSSPMSHTWLSLRISDPKWQPPKRPSDLIPEFLTRLSDEERTCWDAFEAAHNTLKAAEFSIMIANLGFPRNPDTETKTDEDIDLEEPRQEQKESSTPDVERLNQERETAFANLGSVISPDNKNKLNEILVAFETEDQDHRPPGLDLSIIQRYILWRVFNLGWTTDRFGEFDRFSMGHYDRKASKAERIGKKYQWIAYHEIMALIADNYQFRESYSDKFEQTYEGPWQEHFRDIDPSCTLRFKEGGTSWDGHEISWWGSRPYNNFNSHEKHLDWVKHFDDLPRIEELLFSVNPDDGSRWVNLNGYYDWKQQVPSDIEPTDTDRRELWYLFNGYLIKDENVDAFMSWSKGVDFWGRWMPDPPEVYSICLGEYGWSPSWRYIQQEYFGDEGWKDPGKDCPGKVRIATFNYLREGGFDCSIDEGYTLKLPGVELIDGLGLHWNGKDAQFINETGKLIAFDPTVQDQGPSALLIREDALLEFLNKNKLGLFWAILGEKRILGAGFDPEYHSELQLSGAGILSKQGRSSHLKCMFNDARNGDSTGKQVIKVFEG